MSAPGVISIALNTSKPASIKVNVQLVNTKIPAEFWWNMKQKGLISEEYKHI
jgi:D-threo-aldose 1-dehydrogenase